MWKSNIGKPSRVSNEIWEVFLWQSGLSLATKKDQQHSGRFQIGLLKWMAIGNLIQFVSFSKSYWELLLSKILATQSSGSFWDLPLRTLLPVGRLPAFMSTILLSLQKIALDWGIEDESCGCLVVPLKTTPKLISTRFGTYCCNFSRSHWFSQKRMYRVCSMCHMKKLRNLLNSIKEARKTALHAGVPWRFGWLLFTCTSQFVPWLLQKKKTHFTNTSWLLQKSSKKKMTSK